MAAPEQPVNADESPAIRNYVFLCLTALVVLFLVLVRRGLGGWAFLPVLVGLVGAGLRWRLAPALVLTLVVGLLYTEPIYRGTPVSQGTRKTFRLEDWILAGAVLAYFAAQYRLQALTLAVFPAEPRPAEGESRAGAKTAPSAATSKPLRDPRLAAPAELSWLVLAVPIWALLAQIGWILLPRNGPAAYFDREHARIWQGIVMAWILGLGGWLAAGLLGYLRRRSMTGREATLVIQDVLWTESRREQRQVHRWLAWTWFRRRRPKE
jgi:hypothetical protein